MEKVGKAGTESPVSRWWCHWLRWGRGGRGGGIGTQTAWFPSLLFTQRPPSPWTWHSLGKSQDSGLGWGCWGSTDGSEKTSCIGCGCLEVPSTHTPPPHPTKSVEVNLLPGSSPTRLRASQAFILPPTPLRSGYNPWALRFP